MAKYHCVTKGQKIWTGCYIFTWVLLFIGLLIYHIAIGALIPELKDLPDNLAEGFGSVFKFDLLQADSQSTKDQATQALTLCGITPPCGSGPVTGGTPTLVVDTNAQKTQILANFDNSLSMVASVCNDPYFGTDALSGTGDDLNQMMADVNAIDTNQPCMANNALYCSMYDTSDAVLASVSDVNKQIDDFTNSEMVESWKDNADYLAYLHALPYILVISSCFFFGLWYRDGACWCCCLCKDGSKLGCMFIIPHIFFWLIFFIINTIIFAIGLAVQIAADEVTIDVLNNKPTLEVFMVHIQTVYPEFYDLVFKNMEDGLLGMWRASFIFEFFSFLIILYGCCMCCCRPYRQEYSQKVIDASAAGATAQSYGK